MFLMLTRQRRLDLSWLTQERFADLLRRRFRISRSEEIIPGLRTLLLCERPA
jgi:hypothetical protein